MAKKNVSDSFSKFYTQKARAFETAKTAEKQVRGIPVPKGTAGKALITNFIADVAKGGQQNPYIAVEIEVIEPEEHRGKKFTGAVHSIYDSENMDAAGRMSICLDDLEDMGLPREVRESHQSIDELSHALLSTPHYVTFEVKEGYKGRSECKCFACDPPDSVKSDIVEYMGGKYHVVSRDGDQVTIRNVNNPEKTRTVPASEITA